MPPSMPSLEQQVVSLARRVLELERQYRFGPGYAVQDTVAAAQIPQAEMALARAIRIEAAARFNTSVAALDGKARNADIVWPRQLAMYAIRQHCPHATLYAIGRLFGGRDHGTAMHACSTVRAALCNRGYRNKDATDFVAWAETLAAEMAGKENK